MYLNVSNFDLKLICNNLHPKIALQIAIKCVDISLKLFLKVGHRYEQGLLKIQKAFVPQLIYLTKEDLRTKTRIRRCICKDNSKLYILKQHSFLRLLFFTKETGALVLVYVV